MGALLEVEFTDTLMAWDGESHVQSGERLSTFYFRVPGDWATGPDSELQRCVFGVAQRMYEDLNAGFRAADPFDLGYLLLKSVAMRRLSADRARARPWLTADIPAAWEWTPCVVVGRERRLRKGGLHVVLARARRACSPHASSA